MNRQSALSVADQHFVITKANGRLSTLPFGQGYEVQFMWPGTTVIESVGPHLECRKAILAGYLRVMEVIESVGDVNRLKFESMTPRLWENEINRNLDAVRSRVSLNGSQFTERSI